MTLRAILVSFACICIQSGFAQPLIQLKPEALSVGATSWETMFKATTYPISFAPYFKVPPNLPNWLVNANTFSSGGGYTWQWSGHVDVQWKSVRANQSNLLRNARWQSGIFYTGRTVEGQTIGLNTDSLLTNGNMLITYAGYKNSMQYRMLGANIRWIQMLPLSKKERWLLYSGVGYMYGFSFTNNISQTEYFRQSEIAAGGQRIAFTNTSKDLAAVEARNFHMSRLQVPFGITRRLNSRIAVDAEMNLALEWFSMNKRRTYKDEAHGFSLRIAHYF